MRNLKTRICNFCEKNEIKITFGDHQARIYLFLPTVSQAKISVDAKRLCFTQFAQGSCLQICAHFSKSQTRPSIPYSLAGPKKVALRTRQLWIYSDKKDLIIIWGLECVLV